MKKRLYGLILDSDGTVMDSKPNQFEWMKYCVTELYQKPWQYKELSEEFLNEYNNAHRTKGVAGIYEMFGINYDKEARFLWKHYNAWKEKNPPPIVCGMKEVIFEIYERSRPKHGRAKGLRIALNTLNRWPSFEKQFYKSGLINCFDLILTGNYVPPVKDEKGKEKPYLLKPHVYSIEWALDLLDVGPEEALHVGDTVDDVIACRDLRRKDPNIAREVKAVSVTWGFGTKENLMHAKPYKIITEPKQLVKIVEDLGGFD